MLICRLHFSGVSSLLEVLFNLKHCPKEYASCVHSPQSLVSQRLAFYISLKEMKSDEPFLWKFRDVVEAKNGSKLRINA